MKRWTVPVHAVLLVVAMVACGRGGAGDSTGDTTSTEPDSAEITNRIDVPLAVRQNLGITYVSVERRPVRGTERLPGFFELLPEARRDYHAILEGKIELAVTTLDRVEPGQLLYTIESPAWRTLQKLISDACAATHAAEAAVTIAEARLVEMQSKEALLRERIESLAQANVRRAELEASAAELRSQFARLEAEIEASRVAVRSSESECLLLLDTASSYTGLALDELTASGPHPAHDSPAAPWRDLDRIEVRAKSAGAVVTVDTTNGAWAAGGARVLSVIDPRKVRFRAHAPQGDLTRFRNGQAVRIVPPQGGVVDIGASIDSELVVGFVAHAEQRSLPLYANTPNPPAWAKPGVAAYLEVFMNGTADPELALPLSCIMRDGLVDIFFLRDRKNPDVVIRTEADLGVNDGRWVVLQSGVRAGDEVVLDGAYELKLASSRSGSTEGGHFHADGTYHAGDDH